MSQYPIITVLDASILFHPSVVSGISITVAVMLVEPIEHRHLLRKSSSKAKDILLLKWILLGTLLALMYRSVLLATLVSVEYEKQIDTVEDLHDTKRPILMGGNTIMTRLLRTDPRATVKELRHKVQGCIQAWKSLCEG